MRVLFLVPGDLSAQLQTLPAAAQLAEQLQAKLQVACAPAAAAAWSLLPAVERVIPFDFDGRSSLADWANLLGSVREPDFQLCINRAQGRQVDLMLSMSHIPTRIATGGFSATERVTLAEGGWGAQAWQALLQPVGVTLSADAFRLTLPAGELQEAAGSLPSGSGPLLLLAPAGGPGDWPAAQWQALPAAIRRRLPDLRCQPLSGAINRQRAAQVASADVVLASDSAAVELALMLGLPVVALGRNPASLPARQGVQAVGEAGRLEALAVEQVLQALGFA